MDHDFRSRLGRLLDDECDPGEAKRLLAHIESCAACKVEWEELKALREEFQRHGRDVPPPPAWESVESRLPGRTRGAISAHRPWSIRHLLPAAAAILIVISGSSFYITRTLLAPRSAAMETVETSFGQVLDLYLERKGARDPAVSERYLAAHQGRPLSKNDLTRRVSFRPLVPGHLPGGFRLDKVYVLATRCCNGTHLRYVRGDQVVALFQQAPGHPTEWRGGDLQDVILAGVSCRRARVGDVELVQVDPVGRNITLVARTGSVKIGDLVRFLGAATRM